MNGTRGDMTNSHYLNQKNRIYPTSEREPWTERDADYNIREGLTFGESEEITIKQQGWNPAE